MRTQRIRTALSSVGVGLLATTAIALAPSLAATPASAGDERPACSKENPLGSSDKKCPSPPPTTPPGNETGCRDVTKGFGVYRGVSYAPELGTVLSFTLTVDHEKTPTCSQVSYTVIARDQDTLVELGRSVQQGNDTTSQLTAAFQFPSYSKEAIAVDVIVSEGTVVHDIAPDSRTTVGPWQDIKRDDGTSGPQTWN